MKIPHGRRSIVDRVHELQRGSRRTEGLRPAGGGAGTSEKHEIVTSLRGMISRMEQRRAKPAVRPTPKPVAVEEIVDGVFEKTPYGPVFTARSEFSTQMRRGRAGPFLTGIDRLVSPAMATLARQESLAGLNLAELVYFDTETTGLATASGTYVFLAGLGYVDGTIFVVEQLFMRDYNEEPSLLWLLGQRLARYPGLVTYNGRAFDIPLVQARYITNRVFDAPIPEQHLDMLPPARRLWKARGSGCRLTTLEQEVLGVEREGDVPGHLIPGIYFDAVHRSILSPLRGVFYHNAEDILSLAALTLAGASLLEGVAPSHDAIGEDLYSVGRVLEQLGDRTAADRYRKACEWGFRDSRVEKEALCRLARLQRRSGEKEEAISVFSTLAEEGGLFRAFALIELAKHLEHAEREFGRAYELTMEALRVVRRQGDEFTEVASQFRPRVQDVEHRLRRLDARRQGKPWRPRPVDRAPK